MLALVGVFLAIGLFNLVVDPYGLYGVVDLPGFNANKHIATNHSRMIKPHLIKTIQPKGIIMGSSRAEVGMDPEHPGWGAANQPVYNYAFGGIGIAELADRFEEAVTSSEVKRALIGIDFYMFNAYLGNWINMFTIRDRWLLYAKTLWSVDVITDSFNSLRKQDPVEFPELMDTGQIAKTFNTRRVAKHGHRHGFLRFERHFIEDTYFPLLDKEYSFQNPHTGYDAFDSFRKILRVASRHDIELTLYISPSHARILEVIRQVGLWDEYETWKKTLVQIMAEEASKVPKRAAVELYDFSTVNALTTEEVPALNDTETLMQFYWECSHFKKELGDLVQDRIFGINLPDEVPVNFGVQLTPENVPSVLSDTLILLDAYLAENPDDYEDIVSAKNASTWRVYP